MKHWTWVLVLAVGCGGGGRAPEAATDSVPPAPAPLAYLAGLAGRYPADAGLWTSEPLRSRMTRLLGGDYEAFLENMRTTGPVGTEGGLVYLTGNCPSSAKDWGAAVLVADPAGDRLLLKLYSEQWDSVRTWQEGEISPLPKDVMTVLAGWTDRMEQARRPKAPRAPAKPEPG